MVHLNIKKSTSPRKIEEIYNQQMNGTNHQIRGLEGKASRFQIQTTDSCRHPSTPNAHNTLHTLSSPPQSPPLTSTQHTLHRPTHPPPLAMPRTPKSTSQRQRWTLLSFFSSGFSDRPTAASTTTTTSSSGATKPSPMKEQGRQEKGNAAEGERWRDQSGRVGWAGIYFVVNVLEAVEMKRSISHGTVSFPVLFISNLPTMWVALLKLTQIVITGRLQMPGTKQVPGTPGLRDTSTSIHTSTYNHRLQT